MEIRVFSLALLIAICVCFRTASPNPQGNNRFSTSNTRNDMRYRSKIIRFEDDDDEPLLPKPTFSSHTAPIGKPIRKISPKPSEVTSTSPPVIKVKPTKPKSTTARPYPRTEKTVPTTVTSPSVKSSTVKVEPEDKTNTNSTYEIEEPILEGSFYVPFKEMRIPTMKPNTLFGNIRMQRERIF